MPIHEEGVLGPSPVFPSSIRDATIWSVLVLQGRGCFIVVGSSTKSVALVSARTGRDSSPIWKNVSPSQLRRRIGKRPCSSSEPHHWELGGRWKGWLEGWRHLKCRFVTIIFPMSWLFVIVAKTRRVLVSFRSLQLLEWKSKNFGDLPWRWLIWVQESWFAIN